MPRLTIEVPKYRKHRASGPLIKLAAAFWRHTQKHYVKNGRPTCEQAGMKVVLRYLRQMYGDVAVGEFTALSLENIREKMIAAGNSRGYINQNINHIFKWGVSKGLAPETIHRAIATTSVGE